MKLNKKIGIMYFLIIIVLLISSDVLALGISPAQTIVDFKVSLNETAEFKVINSEHKSMKVLVYMDGTQDEEIDLTINTPELIFTSDDEEKTASYSYSLPQKFKEPGLHEISIIAREVPIDSETAGTLIGASVAVEHVFKINVPYPGKYATTELKVSETNNNAVNFIVVINNLGSEQITNAKGLIDIFDSKGVKLTSLETSIVSVDSGLRKEVMVAWSGVIEPGEYRANLNLVYDNMISEYVKNFQIGEAKVNILHIYSNNFKLGQIAKFNILIENKWSEKIKDVYTDLLISDEGKEIGRFKSATEDIDPSSNKELTAYWDSEGVEVGEYDAKFMLHYNDKVIEKDMKTKIDKNSISFSGFSGAVVSDSPINTNNIIAFVVIIVVVSAIWIVYFKFKKKK
nr:hypothetical protein [Nanoarchaeum sp.]